MTRAAVSSGRSDFVTSRPLNFVSALSGPGGSASTGAALALSPAGSNAVARTVTTLTLSLVCTVMSTLPA
jgi:hypothetical protein